MIPPPRAYLPCWCMGLSIAISLDDTLFVLELIFWLNVEALTFSGGGCGCVILNSAAVLRSQPDLCRRAAVPR